MDASLRWHDGGCFIIKLAGFGLYMKKGAVNVPFTSITWICAKRLLWHTIPFREGKQNLYPSSYFR